MTEESLDALGLKYGTDKASSGHNYLEKYEFHLRRYRHETFTLIEIGALKGASIRMWRDYFPNARIVCLDIRPEVKEYEGDRVSIEIGDSGNVAFLKSVAAKYGPARIIIDDGSHRWDHMRIAFRELYPLVEPGGSYVVEDLHSNYEAKFAGADDIPFVRSLYNLVDVMNSRGEARRLLTETLPPAIVKAATVTDSVSFVGRSCILAKKAAKP